MSRLVEEGAAPDEQLQNLLMQQQNEIYSLTESKGMLQASIVDLCSLLNIDNTDGFDIIQDDDTDMYLENSIENIINSAMTLPQIEVVNQKLLSAKYAIKIAKSDLYPSLSFNSSYSSSYSSTRRQVAFDENGTPIIVDGAIAYKNYPFIIKEVAILFETGGNKQCDKVILITAPEELRIERAMKRDNLTKKDILVRIKNQISESKKKELSDFVVENINLNNTFLKIDEILKILAKL